MFGILNLGMWEIVLILIIALIVFGPGKLPEVGKAIGRGIKEFKGAASAITEDDSEKEKRKMASEELEEKKATSEELANREVENKPS